MSEKPTFRPRLGDEQETTEVPTIPQRKEPEKITGYDIKIGRKEGKRTMTYTETTNPLTIQPIPKELLGKRKGRRNTTKPELPQTEK